MNVTLPNGAVISGVPEGTSREAIKLKAIAGGLATDADFSQPVSKAVETPQGQATVETPEGGSSVMGYVEPALTIASGALAEVPAGLAGIAQAVNPCAEEGAGARAVEATREAFTYEPRTEEGRAGLETLAETVAPVTETLSAAEKGLGDFAFELTGSPTVAAAATALPAAVMEALGFGVVRKMRAGTRLLDNAGQPTKALEKALDKKGVSFEGLSDSAKQSIPEFAPRPMVPKGRVGEAAGPAERALIEQIHSGARDDALAKFTVQGGRVAPDKLAIESVRQGFPESFVAAVKTATPETRQAMRRMLNMRQRIAGNQRLELDFRPSDVIGDSLNKRVSYIRKSADDARKELDSIAREKLPGKKVDTQLVADTLEKSLDDLDIELRRTDAGDIEPDFEVSMISESPTSKRFIRSALRLLAKTENPDALALHKLKRQMDAMVDDWRKSSRGLPDAGKNVLKNVRRSINQVLRDADPDYARVNDVLKQSLDAMDDFQGAVGPSVNIFGEGSSKAVGQELRKLMSKYQKRVKLESAVNRINDTAENLGGTFGDDIKDLALFAKGLEHRFGSEATSSFASEIKSATEQALKQGARETARDAVAKKVAEGVEKARGINDVSAFRAMRQLIDR